MAINSNGYYVGYLYNEVGFTMKKTCVAGIKLKNSVHYTEEYALFEDRQIVTIADIEIKC